jgi:hypothetical protein
LVFYGGLSAQGGEELADFGLGIGGVGEGMGVAVGVVEEMIEGSEEKSAKAAALGSASSRVLRISSSVKKP